MVYQPAANCARVPMPAKACMKFLRHIDSKESGCSDASACGVTSTQLHLHNFPEKSTQLPILLGSRENYTMQCVSFSDSPPETPTTTDGFERTATGCSTRRSISTTGDDLESSHSTSSWKLEVKHTFVHVTDSSDEDMAFAHRSTKPSRSASHSPSSRTSSRLDTWTSLPLSQSMRPSVGSALHGTGFCKPCAWFWRPQGCGNGVECRHCHSCPENEIKRRRKVNQSTRRRHVVGQV